MSVSVVGVDVYVYFVHWIVRLSQVVPGGIRSFMK